MNFSKLTIFLLAAGLAGNPALVTADDDIPFDEARLFFELNDTDGDLGIHGKVDGDEWKYLEIEDTNERRMLNIRVRGRLRRQGLTELFFESAEPPFEGEDALDPADFFKRFPEGWYEIEGITLDGEERESEVYLSHVIPAAPAGVTVNGEPAAEDCDAEDLPEVSAPVTLTWDAVTTAHEELGRDPGSSLDMHGISVIYYEVVVEIDETPYKSTTLVPADVTRVELPRSITDLIAATEDGEGEFKFEILVRTDNGQTMDDDGEPIEPNPGNKSAIESCFVVVSG